MQNAALPEIDGKLKTADRIATGVLGNEERIRIRFFHKNRGSAEKEKSLHDVSGTVFDRDCDRDFFRKSGS
jgi:hypothetical protein